MNAPTLRPRDIQARIRSGESAESVADAAGTTVEKIMPFAAPVIAEREHVAERALKASVRRRPADPVTSPAGTARTLGSAVETHLSSLDVPADTVEWDAWRRTDGRWSLVAVYEAGSRSGTAELTFDPPGNFVSLDNDDARWLVGDLVVPEPEPVRDDLAQVRERRLAPVPRAATVADDVLPIEEPLEAFLPEAPLAPARETPAASAAPAAPTAPAQPETPAAEAQREPEPTREPDPFETRAERAPQEPSPARRTPAKKRGRASVPSWDEIMFGGGGS